MLVRSPCKHSRGSWSRSPSPLTTSGTVPQLFLHPPPTDGTLRTLSGKLVLSTYDIRVQWPNCSCTPSLWCFFAGMTNAPTVPAPHSLVFVCNLKLIAKFNSYSSLFSVTALSSWILQYFPILKGLSHEIVSTMLAKIDRCWLNNGRGWFLNFSEAPLIFSWN